MTGAKALAPAALLCVFAGLPALAEADGNGRIDARLGLVLGKEQAALASVKPGHVERIVGPASEAAPEGSRSARNARAHGGDDLACLARALYFEARGEGSDGMQAVAEVVLNRVDSGLYPNSICAVVYQGARSPGGCQFSFACDGNGEMIGEPRAWSRAEAIARRMAGGAARSLTGGATHFHTVAVNPNWAQVFPKTARIGTHLFYRKPVRVAGN